jgi:methyl-accepting chemotaxis protein
MLSFKKSTVSSRAVDKDAEIKSQIADRISAAIMTVDRDFIVNYVNEPTRELLKKNESAFRAIWPGFSAD